MQESMYRAVGYLERRLPNLNNAYAVAMVSYALAVANKNKFNKRILYRFASTGFSNDCLKHSRNNVLLAISNIYYCLVYSVFLR